MSLVHESGSTANRNVPPVSFGSTQGLQLPVEQDVWPLQYHSWAYDLFRAPITHTHQDSHFVSLFHQLESERFHQCGFSCAWRSRQPHPHCGAEATKPFLLASPRQHLGEQPLSLTVLARVLGLHWRERGVWVCMCFSVLGGVGRGWGDWRGNFASQEGHHMCSTFTPSVIASAKEALCLFCKPFRISCSQEVTTPSSLPPSLEVT